jgi:hypothetical protein
MPNPSNIEEPVVLVAYGRSGTSLMGEVFAHHPDFSSVGETANLIFGAWHALEFSAGVIAPLEENGRTVEARERAGRVVRQAMLTCAPDDRSYWFQKPIGVPLAISTRYGDGEWAEAAEWYWEVMRRSFPRAKYFTVLRHPCDVVASARAYWGYEEGTLWWSLGLLSYIVGHPSSPVRYAIGYDDLVQDGEAAVRDLFAYLEVPFHERVLGAFSRIHAPANGRETLTRTEMSRTADWNSLDPACATPKFVGPIHDLFAKFGREFVLPAGFGGSGSAAGGGGIPADEEQASGEPHEATIARLQQKIDYLNNEIGRLHADYTRKLSGASAAPDQAERHAACDANLRDLEEQRLELERQLSEFERDMLVRVSRRIARGTRRVRSFLR